MAAARDALGRLRGRGVLPPSYRDGSGSWARASGLRYAGLLIAGLFVGTLVIFLIAPAVSYGETGFPNLSLAGQFLLKDVVLLSAGLMVARSASMPGRAMA